jgi:alkanesulfonate monooxygenase SsuD/methylene tetrahydromethanopterin reductase-like flavin-dependent oxidoreductase (luciferase family)
MILRANRSSASESEEKRGDIVVGSTRGFGMAGESPTGAIGTAAIAAEQRGYHSFWLSQPHDGDTLSILSSLAETTRTIRLGVGAIPFTRQSAAEIAAQIEGLALPRQRLRLGVGSGTGPGSLVRLRDGVRELRTRVDVEIVVAPLGPKMCRLAGEVADTVLLNWLTPAYAEASIGWIRDGAAGADRDVPTVGTYVRCAIGPAARARLEAECARYGSFPHYAAHFRRQDVEPIGTTIWADSAEGIQEGLHRYDAVLDHVVVRAITPHDAVDEVLALVEGAKPSG